MFVIIYLFNVCYNIFCILLKIIKKIIKLGNCIIIFEHIYYMHFIVVKQSKERIILCFVFRANRF